MQILAALLLLFCFAQLSYSQDYEVTHYTVEDGLMRDEVKGILNQGDTCYIFSDSLADQFGGEKGKKYMIGKFKKLLIAISKEPIDNQKETLDQEFEIGEETMNRWMMLV